MKLFGREPAPHPTSWAGVSEAPLAVGATLSMALTILEWSAVGIARATHGRETAR